MFAAFVFFLIVSIIAVVWGVISENNKILAGIVAAVCIAMTLVFFFTPQSQMYWIKFKVGAQKGTWLIVDNSGGETMRHWVLRDGYVKGCDQTDGWEFFGETCSPCYVGGDSFVGKITREQLENDKYKKQFNIPLTQEALH